MEATKEETKAGARRWRRHKEGGGSEEDTSDGARDLGAEMGGARSVSEEEGEIESGDSSGESPESAAEADETHVEEERSDTKRRAPRRRRNTDNRVVSGDESESERSGDEEEQEAVDDGEEAEAGDEDSNVDEQGQGERRRIATRKRS